MRADYVAGCEGVPGLNYYPFHLGDYAAHTAHLEPMEDLAYRRMLDLYYRTEKALPRDVAAIARLIRMGDYAATIRDVLNEFFTLTDDGWTNERCAAEVEKMQDKQAKAKASAQASVNARSANAQRTLNERSTDVELPTPTPTPFEEKQPTVVGALPAEDPPSLSLVSPKPKGPPDCPHLEVLALWGEVLPAMPQHLPSMWRGARADHLRARWRETAVEKGWTDQQQGLEFLRRLFGYVGQSKFLTGRCRPSDPGRSPFVAELEWIVNPTNWAKLIEGKYHQEAA